jgi:hypothetical protein
MFARAVRTELRAEGSFLNRVELLEADPGFVANGAGDVDSESNGGHCKYFNCSRHAKAFNREEREERPRRMRRSVVMGATKGDGKSRFLSELRALYFANFAVKSFS